MFVVHATLRTALSVAAVLILAFILTAAASSAYKRERIALGEAHFNRAEWSAGHGRLNDALEEYRQSLLFSPDDKRYRQSLGIALMNAGHLTEAEAHLNQLLQEDPTNGRINLALARIAAKRGNKADAIESYQRAVYEYWPASQISERRQARWELVGLLENERRYSEVVGELIQLYASSPNDPEERSRIGLALLKYGAVSEAAEVFTALERKFPGEAHGHRGLAEVDMSLGTYVAARHEFQHALRLDPNDRESAAGLSLTNSVIDLDPALAGISSAERLRRSENLLTRVLNDLDECSANRGSRSQASSEPAQQLELARKMLADKRARGDDPNLTLQQTALKLWQSRLTLCGVMAPPDRATELALAQVRQ